MDPLNPREQGLEKMFAEIIRAFRERAAEGLLRQWTIPRVYSTHLDDTDADDLPDAPVGVRLRPHQPHGGLAIALSEPDDDPPVEAVGSIARR